MVQCIGDDCILFGKKRFEQTAVGIETSCVKNRVLCLEIITDRSLKLLVKILRAADETNRRHAESTVIHRPFRRFYQTAVVCKTKIIVGTEIQHFTFNAFHFYV